MEGGGRGPTGWAGRRSELYTACSFQTMPENGFWCSWGKPRVWPISCTGDVDAAAVGPGRSQPRFIVRSPWPGILIRVGADVRPRPIALKEADADLGLAHVLDLLEGDPNLEALPNAEALAHEILLVVRRRSWGRCQEPVVELGAVDPLLVGPPDQPSPVGGDVRPMSEARNSRQGEVPRVSRGGEGPVGGLATRVEPRFEPLDAIEQLAQLGLHKELVLGLSLIFAASRDVRG